MKFFLGVASQNYVVSSYCYSLLFLDLDICRYKKLMCMVDLTKDFFFSYSYHIMRSLQKNMCDNVAGQVPYDTMFVWNEFLTSGIRNVLHNTFWTVALVYGFFKQVILSALIGLLKINLFVYCLEFVNGL